MALDPLDPRFGPPNDLGTLAARLAALERSNRRWKRLAAAAALGALTAAVVGMSAPPSRTVDAEVIRILDSKGKARMILSAADDGPTLALLDGKGRLRASLGVSSDGPSLDLLDESESPRAQLTVDAKQEPHLDFTDAKGVQVTLRP